MRRSRTTGFTARAVLAVMAMLAGAAGVIVAVLPARHADLLLAHVTHDRVRLAQTQGSIWEGSARLVLSPGRAMAIDGASAGGIGADRRVLAGVTIPGRVFWTLRPLPLLLGRLDLRLRPESMAQPVRVQGDWQEIRIDSAAIELPAVELGRLGSPWNTVRPAGALRVGWDPLVLRRDGFDGRAWIELHNVSSSMTPVRPLGSYRVDLTGGRGEDAAGAGSGSTGFRNGAERNRAGGAGIGLHLTTIEGSLQLQGSGDFDPVRGLRFVAEASAGALEKERLQAFLGLLGEQRGEHTIIRIGA